LELDKLLTVHLASCNLRVVEGRGKPSRRGGKRRTRTSEESGSGEIGRKYYLIPRGMRERALLSLELSLGGTRVQKHVDARKGKFLG